MRGGGPIPSYADNGRTVGVPVAGQATGAEQAGAQPRGRVIDGFLAGPVPGSTRFGNTRCYRHPDPTVGRTAAVGELTEFWVERDDLVPVPTAEVEGYETALPPTR